jgi:hypothetical protein
MPRHQQNGERQQQDATEERLTAGDVPDQQRGHILTPSLRGRWQGQTNEMALRGAAPIAGALFRPAARFARSQGHPLRC